jgi:hypothetical protein
MFRFLYYTPYYFIPSIIGDIEFRIAYRDKERRCVLQTRESERPEARLRSVAQRSVSKDHGDHVTGSGGSAGSGTDPTDRTDPRRHEGLYS